MGSPRTTGHASTSLQIFVFCAEHLVLRGQTGMTGCCRTDCSEKLPAPKTFTNPRDYASRSFLNLYCYSFSVKSQIVPETRTAGSFGEVLLDLPLALDRGCQGLGLVNWYLFLGCQEGCSVLPYPSLFRAYAVLVLRFPLMLHWHPSAFHGRTGRVAIGILGATRGNVWQ